MAAVAHGHYLAVRIPAEPHRVDMVREIRPAAALDARPPAHGTGALLPGLPAQIAPRRPRARLMDGAVLAVRLLAAVWPLADHAAILPPMALTDRGKELAMSVGIASATRYVSLHLADGTELDADHGYARKAITTAEQSVSGTGVLTVTTPLDVYTADDAAAQDADQAAMYDAATGGAQIYEPEDLTTDVAAPGDGQTFRLTSCRFNP